MQEKDYVSYEYKTKTVKAKDLTRAMDLYEAFGWEITSTMPGAAQHTTLSLKRDRKQKHKAELTKLERQAENTFDTVKRLDRSRTLGASVFAYVFGVIATLLLGGGMCMVMLIEGSVPAVVGGVILGAAGIVLLAVNLPVYRALAAKKTKQVIPMIDQTEEKLANLLEQGNDLLRADLI